jgi:hypothetical protein
MPVLILNSLFGNTFTLYSVAPVAWLLVGWISAGQVREVATASSQSTVANHDVDIGGGLREQFVI